MSACPYVSSPALLFIELCHSICYHNRGSIKINNQRLQERQLHKYWQHWHFSDAVKSVASEEESIPWHNLINVMSTEVRTKSPLLFERSKRRFIFMGHKLGESDWHGSINGDVGGLVFRLVWSHAITCSWRSILKAERQISDPFGITRLAMILHNTSFFTS